LTLGLPLLLALVLYLFWSARPVTGAATVRDSGRNVILITWDGVRRDELMGRIDPVLAPGDRAPLLPYFWDELAPRGRIYGDSRDGTVMTIANPTMVSLPAYQSIFAGSPQACQGNDCGQMDARTFPERLVQDLGLPRRKVATIASWEGLMFGVEGRPGTTFVNAGICPLDDGAGALGPELARLNAEQAANVPPWPDARFDRYTWAQAARYLKVNHPRFLYISFDDADAHGHRGEYASYLAAIRRYDGWLKDLVATLAGEGAYGRDTCLIVTTDHGRGLGDNWSRHSNGEPYSALVMMYAGCPLAGDGGGALASAAPVAPAPRLTTHLDIRPTVEQLFGLQPQTCLLCGKSLLAEPGALGGNLQGPLSQRGPARVSAGATSLATAPLAY
jgi:hypothetical protein